MAKNSHVKNIGEVIGKLITQYVVSEEDRPESVLKSAPLCARIIESLKLLIEVMFPGRTAESLHVSNGLKAFLETSLENVWNLLRPEIEKAIPYRWLGEAARAEGGAAEADPHKESVSVMTSFFSHLPEVRATLIDDIRAAYEGDPAALTFAEVILAYPGILAITSHRLAHELYKLSVPIVPRIMSEWTHTKTGIDIHPGAKIGRGFFIDHGTGVVIGETSRIGNRVKLYQGVTIGAKSFPLDDAGRPIKHIQRHPTVEDEVVIYANATILGGDTVIGTRSSIGGNVFLMESVPPDSVVVRPIGEVKIKTSVKG